MIAKKIDELRKSKDISLEQLASKIGFSVQGLHKALKTDDLKISVLQKIADALDVDITYFFEGHKTNFEKNAYDFFQMNVPNTPFYIFDTFIMERLYMIYYFIMNSNKKLFEYLKPYNVAGCYFNGENCVFKNKNNEEFAFEIPINIVKFVEDITGNKDNGIVDDLNLIFDDNNNSFIDAVYDNEMIKWFLANDILKERSLIKTISDVLYIHTPFIPEDNSSTGTLKRTYKLIKNIRSPFEK